jgi:outer membrane receptor for ferric coprogen and ferric-rhodotorulic acid
MRTWSAATTGSNGGRIRSVGDAVRGMLPVVCLTASGSAAALLLSPPAKAAEEQVTYEFNLPSQAVAESLRAIGQLTSLNILFDPETVRERNAPEVRGVLTASGAISRVIAGMGLEIQESANVILIRRAGTRTSQQTSLRLAQVGPGAAGSSTLGGTSSAQDDPSLEEVVVSGFYFNKEVEISSKSLLSIRETPQAISVITLDSLKARQVTGLGQALEGAASITQSSEPGPFAGRSATGFTTFQIRGVELPFYYGVYEDGFLFPQIAGTLDLAPYERLEVVKGPNSALYGQGAAGGFINLVRKKPMREFQMDLEASVGSYDFHRVDADVTGPLSASGRVLGRVALGYEDAGAFIDSAESERIVVAPHVQFALTDSTNLSLQGTYQDDRFVPHYGVPLQRTGPGGLDFKAPEVRRSLYFGVPNEDLGDNTRKLQAIAVKLDHGINDRWLADLRLSSFSAEQDMQQARYAYFLDSAGNTSLYSSVFNNEGDVWSAELRLNGRVNLFGRKANITFGAETNEFDYHRMSATSGVGPANIYDGAFGGYPDPAPGVPYTTESNFEGQGLYGQLYFRPLDRLAVLVGGRYSKTDTYYRNEYFGFVTERDTDDERFIGRAGLTFDANEHVAVYGLYAESFIPVTFAIASDGNPLEPEVGNIAELGVKTEWLDRKLGINAAVFRLERDKVPIPDPANVPPAYFSVSAGLQRSEGFELEINGEPVPGWNLSFGGTLLDSEFIEEDDPNRGNTPRGVADWQVSFFTSYQLQGGFAKGLGFSMGMFAIDDRPVVESQQGRIDGYQRVDFGVFYDSARDVRFAVQLRNAFDEEYIETLERPNALNHFGSPRAVMATVRKKF